MAADDFISALLRNQYAAPGGANLAPGGSVMGYPAASGQGPNMGYPSMGMGGGATPYGVNAQSAAGSPGGAVPNLPITPQLASQIGGGGAQQAPPFLQIGGFHPGNMVNPDLWHDLAVTKAKLASLVGMASPASAAGVTPDTPHGTGPPDPTGASVQAGPGVDLSGQGSFPGGPPSPYGTGIMPGFPASGGAGPSILPQARGLAVPPDSPQGSPSATPRPSGALAKSPLPPVRPAATSAASASPPTGRRGADGRFTTVQYQANPGRNQPIYTALNLFGRG